MLKLRPPRKGKSPYFTVNGTYLGQPVKDRSTKTHKRKIALGVLREIEREIESGRFAKSGEPNFGTAVNSYLDACGEPARGVFKRMEKLTDQLGDMPLSHINQQVVDETALAMFPRQSPATRNREVYTPISAVLKHAGVSFSIRRPKGGQGRTITAWLTPEQAQRMFAEADKIDREFGILLRLLCYTGMRLGEATERFMVDQLEIKDARAFIAKTKNGSPRLVHLPPHIVAALANHPRGLDRPGETVFRWKIGYRIYKLLALSAKAADVELPRRAAFHLFRHTYATWMRRYAGADARTLVGTGAWDAERSANRYVHTVQSEEARLADLLPVGKTAENEPKLKIVGGNQ